MALIRLHAFSALLVMLLCWLPASSLFAMMEGQFVGTVTDSYVEGPPFSDPFGQGAGSGVLNALVVTGSFFYEPDLAPDDVDGLPNSVYHQTNGQMGDASDLWFSMPKVYIDGQLVPLPIFVEPPTLGGANVARIVLADEVFGGNDSVEYFRSKFETLLPFPDTRDYNVSVNLAKGPTDPNIIDSLLLTNAFEVTDFTNVNGYGQVQARQTNPGSPTYEFFADFDLSFFAVPEPSLSAGLAAGWVGVLALARLRRRTRRR